MSIRILADGLYFYAHRSAERKPRARNVGEAAYEYVPFSPGLKDFTARFIDAFYRQRLSGEQLQHCQLVFSAPALLMPADLWETPLKHAIEETATLLRPDAEEPTELFSYPLAAKQTYQLAFRLPTALKAFLQRSLETYSLRHVLGLLLQDAIQQAPKGAGQMQLSAIAADKCLSVLILKQGQLLLANSYPYEAEEDLKYRLTQLLQQTQMNPKMDLVRLYIPDAKQPGLKAYLQERLRYFYPLEGLSHMMNFLLLGEQ